MGKQIISKTLSPATTLKQVYLGLGSNLGEPAENIRLAFELIRELPSSCDFHTSTLVHSKALGPSAPDYVNAVMGLKTTLSPLTLLFKLQQIEQAMGRRQARRWYPRLIDIDILLYDNEHWMFESLVIPHPGIKKRPFVYEPLKEISQSSYESLV